MNKKIVTSIVAIIIVSGLCVSAFYAKALDKPDKSEIAKAKSPQTVSQVDVISKDTNSVHTSATQDTEDKSVAAEPEKTGSSQTSSVTAATGSDQSSAKTSETSKPAAAGSVNTVVASSVDRQEVSRGKTTTDTSKYPLLSKVNGSFGQFRYRNLSGGRIEVDPQWVAENIVTITLPGLNQKVQVHKNAADNFITAFNYIKNGTAVVNGKEVPLLSLIKTMDGTYVTRHVNWDASRGLSNHSWGTAIDINANGHFGYVDPEKDVNDPNLILWKKAFEPAGFSWGNRYSDSMHFELLK
jgi:hypothetical protein